MPAIRRADALITEARQAQIEQERQTRIAQHKQAVAQRRIKHHQPDDGAIGWRND